MVRPEELLRSSQIDRGVPDLHDIPDTITTGTIKRYIDRSGRERQHMARNRRRFPAYHDFYLRQHRSSRIVKLASIVATSTEDLTK